MDAVNDALAVRPCQLLCVVCRLGARPGDAYACAERLDAILARTRRRPEAPLTLRANVDSVYRYQNPGGADDTPEGALYNAWRDLAVLQRLGLVPGATRPAGDLFARLFREIPDNRWLCGANGPGASAAWRGCPLAASGNYERGRALGLAAVVPPRPAAEKERAKAASARTLAASARLEIRPHHLLCMTCFHGGRADPEPIAEDNLAEAIAAMRRNPEIPVRLIAGPCMICPPCSSYRPDLNLCVGGISMGLRDEWKDLETLRLLDLEYGATLPARELLNRLYARVAATTQVCGYGDGVARAPEWRVCHGPGGSAAYVKGRAAGLGVPGVAGVY